MNKQKWENVDLRLPGQRRASGGLDFAPGSLPNRGDRPPVRGAPTTPPHAGSRTSVHIYGDNWVVVMFMVLQNLEGNLLTPMIQRKSVDLPPALVDASGDAGLLVSGGSRQVRHHAVALRVHREEVLGGRRDVRAERELVRLSLGTAQRDRDRHEGRVLQRVQRDAEGRRPANRLDAELHEVGRVAGIGAVGRIRVGPVLLREQVPRRAGIVRIERELGPVVVVEEVLVDELTIAVRACPGDHDRLRTPRHGVLQLR